MTCTVPMAGRQPCDRPLYDEEKCILHSTRVDKDVDLFKREMEALAGQEQPLDCTSFIVPEKGRTFERQTFAWDVSFRHAVFLGSAGFSGARFLGKADFTGVQFTRADFTESQFEGPALFARCQFIGDVAFTGSRFQDMLSFHNAHFAGPANFSQIRAGSRADFSRAEFAVTALFSGARFRAGVNFATTQFQQRVGFVRARFVDEVYFSETRFPGAQEYPNDTGVDLTEVSFERPEKVHFYLIDASRLSFLKTQLRRVDFTDVAWGRRKNGRAALWDEIRPEGIKDYAEVARLYRQLRTNFEKEGDHRAAADFRYGQMEMRRLDVRGGNPARLVLARTFSLLTCYKVLSDYGENPSRAAAWILVTLLVFGAMFAFAGFVGDPADVGGGKLLALVGDGLHASLVSLTMQPGHISSPLSRVGEWLTVLEGLIGPLLIVGWGLAVVRSMR